MESQVVEWIGAFSYPAVFVLLILCGMGAPLSEDLVIVTGGIVAAHSGASLPLMMLTAFVGVAVGDSLLFRLGRTLGPRVFSHARLQRILTPSRIHFINTQFSRHGALAVLLVRFLPGFRAPSYLLAGASGFPYRRFLSADLAGAAIVAPVMTWLGYRFGSAVLERLRGGVRWVLLGLVVVACCLIIVKLVRRRGSALGPPPPVERDSSVSR
ncbi:DedA family protein [Myxococcaceae bacterium GXIMD 01537]